LNNTSAEFSNWEYRNIALAATAQCALLVHELATKGDADTRQLRACVDPLLVLDPKSNADVYPNVAAFSSGLNALQQSFSGDNTKQFPEAVRYMLGMTVLQQKLSRMPGLQVKIRKGLQAAQPTDTGFSDEAAANPETNPETNNSAADFPYAETARLYQNTISTLSYRIHVAGNPEHLRNQLVADKIRTLLLAGIRSAVLWQQLGGRRWHLLFYRKQIRESIAQIRRAMMTVNTDRTH